MGKFTNRKIYVLALIWTLSLLFPLIGAGYIPFIDVKKIFPSDGARIEFFDINYIGDSDSMPVSVFPGPRMVVDNIDLVLKFVISNYMDNSNLFQSAPFNDGARLELYLSPHRNIKMALIYAVNNETKVILIDGELQINTQYAFRLKTHNNRIYVYLNNKLSGTGNFNSLEFSDFILGNAMAGTSPFVGQIYLDHCFVSKVSVGKWFLGLLRSRTAYLAYGIFFLVVILSVSLLIFYFVYYDGMADNDKEYFLHSSADAEKRRKYSL
jgi:hypothetical protein